MKKLSLFLVFLMVFAVACSKKTSPCDGVICSGHGTCDDSSGRANCICDDGYVPTGTNECWPETDPCAGVICEEWQTCTHGDCHPQEGFCDRNSDCRGSKVCDSTEHKCKSPCENVDCGDHGSCHESNPYGSGYGSGYSSRDSYQGDGKYCYCDDGYVPDECWKNGEHDQDDDNDDDQVTCDKECGLGNCVFDDNGNQECECEEGAVTDEVLETCVKDACENVNCGQGGVCTVENKEAVCNCPHGFYGSNNACEEITSQKPGWVGVQWPYSISTSVNADPEMVYGRIWLENETGCPLTNYPQHSSWKAELGYRKGTGSAEYPIIPVKWTWIDANFNSGYDCADGNQNHEYMIPFPTDKGGNFIYIFRFSLDGGETWWYGDKGVEGNTPGPGFITSEDNHPGNATVHESLLTLESLEKTDNSYNFAFSYHGVTPIDFSASVVTLNGIESNEYAYDNETKTFTVSMTGLEPDKYSWLFRLVDDNGSEIDPFFVPLWIGPGADYADFGWRDAFIYQIMTDRFLNADKSNDVPESEFPHVTIDLEKWKGGDFAGIIKKIDDDYFTKMGVNAIWISSPVLNPHHESQGGTASGQSNDYFTSYHAYHPLATGYSFNETYGYDNEGVETAFGTADELRELVKKAHKKGIRVIPDFAANHVYIEAEIYKQHKDDGWFYSYNPCDGHWDDHRIDCWFTPYMPDFNYNNADARKAVISHAIWLIQNFNLDGFRADALKHMDDIFTIELRSAIKDKIETTVKEHDLPDEAEVFYMVGESLGGWARYHANAKMVQGQVNEDFYYKARDIILHGNSYNSLAGNVNSAWDEAYLYPQQTNGGTGGFPGAVMGNFFGNHDQERALTECNGNYTLLKHAQTFLLTSPINIPMLYQGDDIGMTGKAENGRDGGRRAVMKFDNLTNNEKDALKHVRNLGKFRKEHPALRYGKRYTCKSTDDVWVYKVKCENGDVVKCKDMYGDDTVIVGINKGSSSYTATCSGESGTFTSYDGSTVNVSDGSVTVPAGGSLVIGK